MGYGSWALVSYFEAVHAKYWSLWRSKTRTRDGVGGRRDDLGWWCGCPVRLCRGLCRGLCRRDARLGADVKMQGERPPWGIRRDDDADKDKSKGGRYLQKPLLMLGDGGGGVGQEIECCCCCCCCCFPLLDVGGRNKLCRCPRQVFFRLATFPLAHAKHGFRLGAPLCGGMNPLCDVL